MGVEGSLASTRLVHDVGPGAGMLRRLILALAIALATVGACASPSTAARGHEFAGAFGWGVLDGNTELQRCGATNCQPGLAGTGAGQLNDPNAIAVNESTGDVYVVDKANNRVEIFDASGAQFEGEFNGSGLLPNEGQAAGSGGQPEEVATGQFVEPEGIAVDNDRASPSFGDVYVADAGVREETKTSHPVIDKFSASGKYIGQITRNPEGEFPESGFRRVFGVAVDPRGELWVDEKNFGNSPRGIAKYTNAMANVWAAFRATNSGISASAFLAVDSEDNLYVHDTLGGLDRLAKFSEGGGMISPEVDEEAPSGVAVELTSDDVYVAHTTNVHRVSRIGASLETLKAPGAPSFSGVAVNAATLTIYVADIAANRVDLFAPEAPGAPTVQSASEAVSDVTATSASFSAEVNPRSEATEAATSYRFEYGPCETATTCSTDPYPQSIPVPEGQLAPNYEPDPIGAHPKDLSPRTVYHMRVVAHNSRGEGRGEELVFTTQGAPSASLPDGRQWELVSSPEKHGATLLPIEGSGVIQAAANGVAISYLANAPSEAQPAGFSQTVQILSRREGSSWQSQDIATPHEATVGISLGAGQGEYRFFTEDLASAIVQPFGPFTQAISPQASEQTAYLRADFPAGDSAHPCESSCYRPLVSGCPGEGEPCPRAVEEVANVPEGTKFSEKSVSEEGTCKESCGPSFLGASPDASHIVLSSQAPLSEEAPEGSLYEWAEGTLTLVSVLPGGAAAETNTRPGLGFVNEPGTIKLARHAISADGSRVVWSERAGDHHLYLSETATEEPLTIRLDTPEASCTAKGGCKGVAHPVFQTGSPDDSRVYFTDSQPLTQGSGDSDLYECRIEETGVGQLACELSDLTPPGPGEEGAGVLGLLAGTSEDGSALYFTANGKLGGEGPSAGGEEATAGNCKGDTTSASPESETAAERCNLYVRSGGRIRLVAVLSGADFADWSLREGFGLRGLSDRVSPDGRYLAFMSRRSLSGYDNRDAVSGKPDQEVFLYDSAAEALSCVSCDPSGGRPRGVQYAKIDSDNGGLAGGSGIWPAGAWIAASIPGWTAVSETEGFALYQSRYLSSSGRLFFNSADALVPGDTNKSEDVYEYEPLGVGDCTAVNAAFARAAGGCIALISSGTAETGSAFLDASANGDDVFFLTGQGVLPNQDADSSLDIYDARVCRAASPCLAPPPPSPPACEGDACQSPSAPPEDQTPGSLTFQGPGNQPARAAPTPNRKTPAELRAEKLRKALTACRAKKRKRKLRACEAKARKLYGPHRAKRVKQTARGLP